MHRLVGSGWETLHPNKKKEAKEPLKEVPHIEAGVIAHNSPAPMNAAKRDCRSALPEGSCEPAAR